MEAPPRAKTTTAITSSASDPEVHASLFPHTPQRGRGECQPETPKPHPNQQRQPHKPCRGQIQMPPNGRRVRRAGHPRAGHDPEHRPRHRGPEKKSIRRAPVPYPVHQTHASRYGGNSDNGYDATWNDGWHGHLTMIGMIGMIGPSRRARRPPHGFTWPGLVSIVAAAGVGGIPTGRFNVLGIKPPGRTEMIYHGVGLAFADGAPRWVALRGP